MWLVGGDADHPVALAKGAVAVSVTMYPATPTLSDAVNVEIGTVREVEVGGMAKAVTVGAVVSAKVMVVLALRLADTFPAASLAHA